MPRFENQASLMDQQLGEKSPVSELRRAVQVLALLRLAGDEINNLMLAAEPVLQGSDVHLLHFNIFLSRHRGSDTCGVASDHPDTFQAQRAKGDVRVARGSGDEEIRAFGGLRGNRSICDLICVSHAPDAALVDELAFVQAEQ